MTVKVVCREHHQNVVGKHIEVRTITKRRQQSFSDSLNRITTDMLAPLRAFAGQFDSDDVEVFVDGLLKPVHYLDGFFRVRS